ncbi:hypothetical protein [Flavimaricola marinus]|uniref:Uncharacterized protein n=1 Tax=Flavimaricola marinus TaxID=1819565 RepID=A0A238LBD9_9RHOB|nr:hypothetical protein [Flavimaricola marinus]SMY06724.1 hypothetical protein LOM8899_00853 [Flavimaricola marinus]
MGIFKAVLKGVGGLSLVCSLALSFAPATASEEAVLGADAPRLQIVQRRLAIGLRDFAPPSVLSLLAQSAKITDQQLADGLDAVINPDQSNAVPDEVAAAQTAAPAPDSSIRAGGALFVKAD